MEEFNRSTWARGRRMAVVWIAVFAMTGPSGGRDQAPGRGAPTGVSVLDFQPDPAFPQQAPAAAVLTELLTADLARLHPGVLDRSAIRRVIEEQRMAAGGLTSADVLRLSRVAGVRYFIRGTVSPGAAPGSVCAHARLFDSETFETLAVLSRDSGPGSDIVRLSMGMAQSLAEALQRAAKAQALPPAALPRQMSPESATTLLLALQGICSRDPWAALGWLVDTTTASPDSAAASQWLRWLCRRGPVSLEPEAARGAADAHGRRDVIVDVAVLRTRRMVPSIARLDGMYSALLKPTESEITEALEAGVLARGMHLINMEDASQALAEQDLKLSGVMDAASAARYGRSLYPDAVLVSTVCMEEGRSVVRLNLMGLHRAEVLGAAEAIVPAGGSLTGLQAAVASVLGAAIVAEPAMTPVGWKPIVPPPPISTDLNRPQFHLLDTTNSALSAWIWMRVALQSAYGISGEPANRLAPLMRKRAYAMLEAVPSDDPLREQVWGNFIMQADAPLDAFEHGADAMPAGLPRARIYLRLASARVLRAKGGDDGWKHMVRLADKALNGLPATAKAEPVAGPAARSIWDDAANLDGLSDSGFARKPDPKPAVVVPAQDRTDPERLRGELAALAYRGRARFALGLAADALVDFTRFEALRAASPAIEIGIHTSLVLDFLRPSDPPGMPKEFRWIYGMDAIGQLEPLASTVGGWKEKALAVAEPGTTPSTDGGGGTVADSRRLADVRNRWTQTRSVSEASMQEVQAILTRMHAAKPVQAKSERDAMATAYFASDSLTLRTRGKALPALKGVIGWYKATRSVPAAVERLVREPLTTIIDPHDLLYAIAQSPMKYWEKIQALKRAEDTYRERDARTAGAAVGVDRSYGWWGLLDQIYKDMGAKDEVFRLGLESAKIRGTYPVGFQESMVNRALDRNLRDPGAALGQLLQEHKLTPRDGSIQYWWANSLQDILPRNRAATRADYERLKAAVGELDRIRGDSPRDLYHASFMIGLGESLEKAAGILREIAAKGGGEGARASEMLRKLTVQESGGSPRAVQGDATRERNP